MKFLKNVKSFFYDLINEDKNYDFSLSNEMPSETQPEDLLKEE